MLRPSCIHCLSFVCAHEGKRPLNGQAIYSLTFNKYVLNKTRYSQYSEEKPRRCNRQQLHRSYRAKIPSSTFKHLNHVTNCCMYLLFNDIEKNPGPSYVDPSKTIHARYSQGNEYVFGSYAGRQCVAMSLSALIYMCNKEIAESQDLIKIMNIGNELYGTLSRLTGQSYLLLNELPTMVTICNTNYQIEFSQCYSGCLLSSALNENIPGVMPLDGAFQSLIQDGYGSFLLTIASNTVAVQKSKWSDKNV